MRPYIQSPNESSIYIFNLVNVLFIIVTGVSLKVVLDVRVYFFSLRLN